MINHFKFTRQPSPDRSAALRRSFALGFILAGGALLLQSAPLKAADPKPGSNPILRDCFTGDPAPVVVGDTVYLIVDHDEAKGNELFTMKDWLCYTSKDMKNWMPHSRPVLSLKDIKWAVSDAWAPQMVPRNGKYYLYFPAHHDNTHPGFAVGVAVADNPLGPYVDARGTALVTREMVKRPFGDPNIDPTVLIDTDGTAWLAWGHGTCFYAKLKPNMTELDGPIQMICVPNYTEGPWLWKRKGLYYLAYASFALQGFGERICYATAPKLAGPWTYRGEITGGAKNSYTIHSGVIDNFHGQSYFFYHNATLTLPDGQTGATGRRCVCVDYLYYNPDGSIQSVEQSEAGVSVPPQPPRWPPPGPVDRGPADPGIKVSQFLADYPRQWKGKPDFATMDDPFGKAPQGSSFNGNGGVTSLGQTFVPQKDLKMARLSFYVGDGMGTDRANTVTLALYDLGAADSPEGGAANAESYSPGPNLLASGNGFRFAYAPQGPGLMNLDFSPKEQVTLKAGHRYALELQGTKDSCPMCWYSSQYVYGARDAYPEGASYRDRKLVKNNEGVSGDLAFAIYSSSR
jgi:hypothetical protein